uniref:Uncharacterized protein n=1 Tax=Timema shepardi TaxID=629360 RepID=A0A7R9AZ13_TIMSH|nr:unnamed protein product [Timema shepardi]
MIYIKRNILTVNNQSVKLKYLLFHSRHFPVWDQMLAHCCLLDGFREEDKLMVIGVALISCCRTGQCLYAAWCGPPQ